MGYRYCARIDENNAVQWVICSNDTDWCALNLGGIWLPVYDNNYPGIGWTWDGKKFIPPRNEEIPMEE